jgi:hypothetical protein
MTWFVTASREENAIVDTLSNRKFNLGKRPEDVRVRLQFDTVDGVLAHVDVTVETVTDDVQKGLDRDGVQMVVAFVKEHDGCSQNDVVKGLRKSRTSVGKWVTTARQSGRLELDSHRGLHACRVMTGARPSSAKGGPRALTKAS